MGNSDNAEYGMLASKVNELEARLAELQASVFELISAKAVDDHAENVDGPRRLPFVMSIGDEGGDGTSLRGESDDESDAATGRIVVRGAWDSNVVVSADHDESDSDTLEIGVYYV